MTPLRILALLLGGWFISMAGGAEFEAETAKKRARRLLDLLCTDASSRELTQEFPSVNASEREPLRRGDQIIGWEQRLSFEDEQTVRLRRIEPDSRLLAVMLEYRDRQRPRFLLRSDERCIVRIARAIRYDSQQRALSIEELNSELEQTGRGLPLNPPVPDGVAPQGIKVALIDSGVNYQLPAIAARLARDRRGRLVGYDFWDMDSRPFDSHPVRSPFFPQRHGTRIASLILREAPAVQLVPYRYPRPDMSRMHALLDHAAGAGVRIVNMSLGGNREDQWHTFHQAARHTPQLLFIVSAGNNGRDIDADPVFPATLDLDNMITVTSSDRHGRPARGSNWGRRHVDLLVPGEEIAVTRFDGSAADASGSSYAAARVTALAARLLSDNPLLTTGELRDKLLALADPAPTGSVRHGWIRHPDEHARSADANQIWTSAEIKWAQVREGSLTLRPDIVVVEGAGWSSKEVAAILSGAAGILSQCGIALDQATIRMLASSPATLDYTRANAHLLMREAGTSGLRAFFIRDTLQRPAFDAFAFGTGNSRSAPALRFTVWLTRAIEDAHIALAHELVHVLLDDATHTRLPGNLMVTRTSPDNTSLIDSQCELVRATGLANGLLSEIRATPESGKKPAPPATALAQE